MEENLGSSNPLAVILATLVGILIYGEMVGTIPVAESLFDRNAGLGTVLSFMIAVTALSLMSISLLRQAIRVKLLGLFLGIVTLGIITIGCVFNATQVLF